MALQSFLFGDDWFRHPTPRRIFNQQFGRGVFDDDPMLTMHVINPVPYWVRPRATGNKTGVSEVVSDGEKFEVNLDVSQFKPEELTIKTVGDSLVVTGKHEEKMDEHGFVSRQFTRRYVLPKDVDPQTVCSNLTPEGVITIKAPKKPAIDASNERSVPIQMAAPEQAADKQ